MYEGTPASEHKAKADITCNVDVTMLDGKVINSLTDTLSTQSCNVCGAKPNEIKNLDVIRKKKSMKKLFSWDFPLFIAGLGVLNIFYI